MWMNVEKFIHEKQKIRSQTQCGITFHMKYTCLHIISTQQELRVDECGKV